MVKLEEQLALGDLQIKLIFMDFNMPVMDGHKATEIIKQNPAFDDIYICGLTAYAGEEYHKKGRDSGMNNILTKPISSSEIT